MKNKKIIVKDIGRTSFSDAWKYQEEVFQKIIEQKVQNRTLEKKLKTNNYLVFTEHNPVYTIGKSGDTSNLLLTKSQLKDREIEFFKINRGGDITFHGPGQIMGYPILDLDNFFTDINLYLRSLENTIIDTLSFYDILGFTIKGETGVWVKNQNEFKKICAFGIRASRWVTMHGFALNVDVNLDYFNNIIPCGLANNIVTSLNKELGDDHININKVKDDLKTSFSKSFKSEFI